MFLEIQMKSKLSKNSTATLLLLFLTGSLLFPSVAVCWAPAPAVSFGPATNYSVGRLPFSVAAGDFNRDGKPDLAVANSGSNNVTIVLGDGDGTFGVARFYGVGDGPVSVTIGDFNGDRKLDLAVANSGSHNVSILLGNGLGTFRPAMNFDVGISPRAVAVMDFNRDGRLDLAVTNSDSLDISILLGIGNGTFAPATNFAVGVDPASVAVGDFDEDGIPDLAVANSRSNDVSILLGIGDGTFGPATNFAAGFSPVSVVVGQFNGGGKLDLAVANHDSNHISILVGAGDGTFSLNSDGSSFFDFGVGTGPASVTVGDFNSDGKPDLAVANSGADNVSILLNANGFSSISVTSPNDSEVWPIGSTQTIRWSSFGITGKVKIAISRNGGLSWATLFSGTANDGTQSWRVGKPQTTQAQIRICSVKFPTICDTGNVNFTIQ